MMDVLLLTKIGWRNLWRHPRGTLLTALASGLGLTLLLVSLGLLDGSHEQMVSNAVRFGTGHVVIQAQGYQDSGSQDLLLPPGAAPAAEAYFNTAAGKDVLRGFSPRLVASGLLSSPANADGVRIMGVIPKAEHDVSLIPQRIVEGAYLGKDQKSGVVIGAELARKLGVKVGSKVVLMTQAVSSADPGAQAAPFADPGVQAVSTADPGTQAAPSADPGAAAAGGQMQSAMLRVTGIFRTGVQAIDAHVIQMPLADAQALLGTPGRVTQIAIRLQRERDSLAVAQSLRKQFTGVPAEILPWREAMPSVAQLFVLDDAFKYVRNGVVLAMVALGILNTILMRVLSAVTNSASVQPRPQAHAVRHHDHGEIRRSRRSALPRLVPGLASTTTLPPWVGSSLVLQEQPSLRPRLRSDHLLAIEPHADRFFRRHRASDDDRHLLLPGIQGRAHQIARRIESVLRAT
jgi:ABC-type lipoprotein release transport system permease subunit